MRYAFAAALCLMAAAPALACSPEQRTLSEQIQSADMIFEGRVLEVKGGTDMTFDVIRYWKGKGSKRMGIRTAASTCGVGGVMPGSVMVVYAKGEPLMTDSTDGTYLEQLPDGRKLRDASMIERALGAGVKP